MRKGIIVDTPKQQRLIHIIEQYDIGDNPAPEALFSFGVSTLTIWCTPADHPGGTWDAFQWGTDPLSQLTKRAEGLATCHLLWSPAAQDVVGFTLQTRAFALVNFRGVKLIPDAAKENRPEDVAWAQRKLVWLWQQALPAAPPPVVEIVSTKDDPHDDFSDVL